MKILYLPIETTARELESKLLIGYWAVRSGFEVIIGSKAAVKSQALRHRRGIFFYKDHSPLSKTILKEIHAAGVHVVALDEEGLVVLNQREYTKRTDSDSVKLCHKVFLWGDAHLAMLESIHGDAGKFVNSGNPRFDLLHPSYARFRDHKSDSVGVPSTPFVLLNTNFAAGNWDVRMYGTVSYTEHKRSRGHITNQQDEDFYRKKCNYYSLLFDKYVSLVRHLSEEFPEISIIVRPHPDENHDRWRAVVADIPNAMVRFKGAATDWMNRANAVIATGCTTGVEALALGKTYIHYSPNFDSAIEATLPSSFSKNVTTIEEVIARVRTAVNENDKREEREVTFVCDARRYIANLEDGNAAETIVRELSSIGKNNSVTSIPRNRRAIISYMFSTTIGRVKSSLRYVLTISTRFGVGKDTEAFRVKAQKFGGISKLEIVSILRFFHQCVTESGDLPLFRVKRVGNDVYSISARNNDRK